MPYVSVHLTTKLDEEQKAELAGALSQAVTCLSGKPRPDVTMVDIADGRSIYLGGKPMHDGAYVDVCVHGHYSLAEKDAYTVAATTLLEEKVGIPVRAVYLTFSEFPSWGIAGKQHTGPEGATD